MFQIATSPSLPVETICLSSGLKAIAAIAPEWARHSWMNWPELKSYILSTPRAPPTAKYLLLFEIAIAKSSSDSPLKGELSNTASAFTLRRSQYVILLSYPTDKYLLLSRGLIEKQLRPPILWAYALTLFSALRSQQRIALSRAHDSRWVSSGKS